MKRLNTLLTLALSLISTIATASNYNVKGVVTDSEGTGEPYATIRIYNTADSIKPVITSTTDIDGAFNSTIDNAGDYRISIYAVGMGEITQDFSVSDNAPTADLGSIALETAENVLGEVQVVAQRPLVSREIDRIGYDVQADEDSKTSTVIEMLRKIPMVSVDADNTIKVRGNTNFKIYKNGRPNNAFSNNPKEVLAAIPASMIKRIEIITEPGAQYDAEGVGAIINIITNDNTAIKGIMGNVSLQANTLNWVPQPNVWLSSQIDKVTFSLYGGYSHLNDKMSEYENDSHYYYKDSGATLDYDNYVANEGDLAYWGFDASYELDSLNLFTTELNGYFYDVDVFGNTSLHMKNNTGSTLYSYNTILDFPKYSYLDFSGSLNYQRLTRRKGETITLSYMISSTGQDRKQNEEYTDMVNMPVNYTGTSSIYNLNFMEHTFQADWARPLTERHTLNFGAKYILRDNHSTDQMAYIGADTLHTDFSHITQVAAAYGEYRLNIGKWSARAGLRYEYSNLKAKFKDGSNPDFSQNLNDWVPSAAISWRANDANSFTFNYATRINRPGISYLNPAEEGSPTSVNTGNPNLKSVRHNSLKLSYMLIKPKFNLNTSVSYEFSNNVLTSYNYVKDNVVYRTYDNIGNRHNLDINAYLQWNPTPKTQVMLNGTLWYIKYKNEPLGMSLGRWDWYAFARVSQQLPWKLRGEIAVARHSGYVNDVYSYDDRGGIGSVQFHLSLQRSFLKDDRLTVAAYWMNPIGQSQRTYTTHIVNGDYIGEQLSRSLHNSLAMFRISYRFGSLNAQVKKTAASIENDDLVGRKK